MRMMESNLVGHTKKLCRSLLVFFIFVLTIYGSGCAVIVRDNKTYVASPVRPLEGVTVRVRNTPTKSILVPPYPVGLGVLRLRGPFFSSVVAIQVRQSAITRVRLNCVEVRSHDATWKVTLSAVACQRYPVGEWIKLGPGRLPPLLPGSRGTATVREVCFAFKKWGPAPPGKRLIMKICFDLASDDHIEEFTEELELVQKHRIFVAPTLLLF